MRVPQTLFIGAIMVVVATVTPPAAQAQLSNAWMVPASAHASGAGGTFWISDVSLHNPHVYDLPVRVQFLPSDTVNHSVLEMAITLYPYETFNLWDVLGPDAFASSGTGALLAFVEPDAMVCDPIEACDFLVTSRTYTLDPLGGGGEFGQAIPGQALYQGMDWWTYGYAAGILNDGVAFRCNIGVASWTAEWTTVNVDVQDDWGQIVATEELEIPPFGHVQRRLQTTVGGGSLVFYLVDGPDDALVYPYASVVNEATGDPSFFAAVASAVGASVDKERRARTDRKAFPTPRGVPVAVGGDLRHRARSQANAEQGVANSP